MLCRDLGFDCRLGWGNKGLLLINPSTSINILVLLHNIILHTDRSILLFINTLATALDAPDDKLRVAVVVEGNGEALLT
jgi:hypothetical protein